MSRDVLVELGNLIEVVSSGMLVQRVSPIEIYLTPVRNWGYAQDYPLLRSVLESTPFAIVRNGGTVTFRLEPPCIHMEGEIWKAFGVEMSVICSAQIALSVEPREESKRQLMQIIEQEAQICARHILSNASVLGE